MNKEKSIQNFWQEHPCGENLTGKLDDWAEHFEHYDQFRYSTEGHILGELDAVDFKGKQVLEIGIGQAADSFQIAKRGAIWNGLDLTSAAIDRARARFELNHVQYGEAKQGSATAIPWPDDSFDIVYSHGVLHHIPDIDDVSREISRVLKPNGKLIIMMYHKNSLNYYLSIALVRRLGLLMIYAFNRLGLFKPASGSVFEGHLNNAKEHGLFNYLKLSRFIHYNTDGPENPFARVYTVGRIKNDFPQFGLEKTAVHFLNARHFPGSTYLPSSIYNKLETKYGWHLWAFLINKK